MTAQKIHFFPTGFSHIFLQVLPVSPSFPDCLQKKLKFCQVNFVHWMIVKEVGIHVSEVIWDIWISVLLIDMSGPQVALFPLLYPPPLVVTENQERFCWRRSCSA